MQELIDMLRLMVGSCKSIARDDPKATAQALQYVQRDALPGIRAGLGNGMMLRIVIERENNVPNADAVDAWNTMWIDPSGELDRATHG